MKSRKEDDEEKGDEVELKASQEGKSADGETVEQINFDELQLKKKIGEGSFGVVYEGSYKGNVVAIKEVTKHTQNK